MQTRPGNEPAQDGLTLRAGFGQTSNVSARLQQQQKTQRRSHRCSWPRIPQYAAIPRPLAGAAEADARTPLNAARPSVVRALVGVDSPRGSQPNPRRQRRRKVFGGQARSKKDTTFCGSRITECCLKKTTTTSSSCGQACSQPKLLAHGEGIFESTSDAFAGSQTRITDLDLTRTSSSPLATSQVAETSNPWTTSSKLPTSAGPHYQRD